MYHKDYNFRLVCLFDLTTDMYNCLDDLCVWRISMKHKKTGGIIHLEDYNGMHYDYF